MLVAGISGAGKSSALDVLSDLGFYAISNLPVALFTDFLELSKKTGAKYARTALILDIDSREKLNELMANIKSLCPKRNILQMIFLDCSTETIIRRYSETRRPHPGFDPLKDKTLHDTIQRERNRLLPIKEAAHFVVDTSCLTKHDLKRELKRFADTLSPESAKSVRVNFLSFGFKYGLPADCDLVIDVRFLPNPHFVDELRDKTGLEAPVSDYVMKSADAQEFVRRYSELLEFLLPRYVFEGKSYVNIGVGCTGGRHRSITIAEQLFKNQRLEKAGYLVSIKHRDIDK